MPGAIDLFLGYEKMERRFVIREYDTDLVSLMLVTDMSGQSSPQVHMVGAQLHPDGRAEAIEWECGGQFYDTDPGEIGANDPEAQFVMMMTLSRSKLTVDGGFIYDVGYPQGKVDIKGVDQWSGTRAILEGQPL